jgi:hypothetical protein
MTELQRLLQWTEIDKTCFHLLTVNEKMVAIVPNHPSRYEGNVICINIGTKWR